MHACMHASIHPSIHTISSTYSAIRGFRQALNGAAGPMNCVTPSALAALWFPASQRGIATSAVYAVQMSGPSVGFLLALGIRNRRWDGVETHHDFANNHMDLTT